MSDDNLIWQLEQVEQQAVVTLNGILNRETCRNYGNNVSNSA